MRKHAAILAAVAAIGLFGITPAALASTSAGPAHAVAQPQLVSSEKTVPLGTNRPAITISNPTYISTTQNHSFCVSDPSGGGVGTEVKLWGNGSGTFCQTHPWFQWNWNKILGGPWAGNFVLSSLANGLCIENFGGDSILRMEDCNGFDGGQAWYPLVVGTGIVQIDSFANTYPAMANSHNVLSSGNPIVGYTYQDPPSQSEEWINWGP